MSDTAYNLTRKKGERVTIIQMVTPDTDPKTGLRTPDVDLTNVRLVVVEPTQYSSIMRAQATQQEVGLTTFLFYQPDISPIRKLTTEDYLIHGGEKYQVVTSRLEDTSLVITANKLTGDIATQVVSIGVSNSMGLSDNAAQS